MASLQPAKNCLKSTIHCVCAPFIAPAHFQIPIVTMFLYFDVSCGLASLSGTDWNRFFDHPCAENTHYGRAISIVIVYQFHERRHDRTPSPLIYKKTCVFLSLIPFLVDIQMVFVFGQTASLPKHRRRPTIGCHKRSAQLGTAHSNDAGIVHDRFNTSTCGDR